MCLTATPSGGVAQTLAFATSKRGLNREARAALLRVETRPECLEDNLRELTWGSEEPKPFHVAQKNKRLHFRVLRKESLEIPWPHPTTCEPIRSQIRISWLYIQDLWPAWEIWIKAWKWEPIRTRGQPRKWKPIRTQHLTLPQKVTN